MAIRKETFSKPEKLSSKKAIEELFEHGRSFYCSPFLIVWSFSDRDMEFPAQAAFSVSKKCFRHAVTRNHIRRRMREAYRRHKYLLYDSLSSSGKKIIFTIVFRGKNILDYQVIEAAVKQMILKFTAIIRESGTDC
jgi:ribonuclease P protein component